MTASRMADFMCFPGSSMVNLSKSLDEIYQIDAVKGTKVT
jgi:hypothetical protein